MELVSVPRPIVFAASSPLAIRGKAATISSLVQGHKRWTPRIVNWARQLSQGPIKMHRYSLDPASLAQIEIDLSWSHSSCEVKN
jgi:hypothetical protein